MGTSNPALTRDRRDLARELAWQVVLSSADELEQRRFDRLAAAHFRPRWSWFGSRPTSFDNSGLAGELVTPVALAVASALLGAVATSVVARLERSLGTIRRRRRRAGEPMTAHTTSSASGQNMLDATELARLRDLCLSAALECHTPEDHARRVADATLAKFVQAVVGVATDQVTDGAPARQGIQPDRSTGNEEPVGEN
ncbi:hypothetical protein ACIQVC_12240 [Streptomyces sp. NPDC101112]|uniref:hypothetical protein n=1 Tax=Streptomyces sp. NPDC101112 TaxID=3366105 RepID=UPI00380E7964